MIEVLVALSITGLLTSLLAATLYFVVLSRDKIRTEVVRGESDLRTEAWLRSVISGLLPVERAHADSFTGNSESLTGLAAAGLDPRYPNVPVRVTLTLRKSEAGAIEMVYEQHGLSAVIGRWPYTSAKFEYFDQSGKRWERWDPLEQTQALLPRTISLTLSNDTERRAIVATIASDPWEVALPKSPFGDVEVRR